jgi:hypothetical protein
MLHEATTNDGHVSKLRYAFIPVAECLANVVWRIFLRMMKTIDRYFSLVGPGPDGFQSAQDEGQISRDVDPHALARMIVSVTHSFSARARVGANRKELSRLAKDFMTALFPSPD